MSKEQRLIKLLEVAAKAEADDAARCTLNREHVHGISRGLFKSIEIVQYVFAEEEKEKVDKQSSIYTVPDNTGPLVRLLVYSNNDTRIGRLLLGVDPPTWTWSQEDVSLCDKTMKEVARCLDWLNRTNK